MVLIGGRALATGRLIIILIKPARERATAATRIDGRIDRQAGGLAGMEEIILFSPLLHAVLDRLVLGARRLRTAQVDNAPAHAGPLGLAVGRCGLARRRRSSRLDRPWRRLRAGPRGLGGLAGGLARAEWRPLCADGHSRIVGIFQQT